MPNPLTLKIQEREKMFDKFGITPKSDSIGTNARTQIKSFHRATIREVLTELDRWMKESYKITRNADEESQRETFLYNDGHNSALTLVRAKLSEAIKELGE